jgi:hypothetical protein
MRPDQCGICFYKDKKPIPAKDQIQASPLLIDTESRRVALDEIIEGLKQELHLN